MFDARRDEKRRTCLVKCSFQSHAVVAQHVGAVRQVHATYVATIGYFCEVFHLSVSTSVVHFTGRLCIMNP